MKESSHPFYLNLFYLTIVAKRTFIIFRHFLWQHGFQVVRRSPGCIAITGCVVPWRSQGLGTVYLWFAGLAAIYVGLETDEMIR